jgi:hypothetical protein
MYITADILVPQSNFRATNVKSDKEAQTLVTWAWYGKRIDT